MPGRRECLTLALLVALTACCREARKDGNDGGGRRGPDHGKGTPGKFDFYVLSLSWSPQHCATQGQRHGADELQCESGASFGFVVHGLWPQFQHGYPESCAVPQPLDQALIRRMLRIMPSKKLIEHEWSKHGTCSGLAAEQYFGHAEELMDALKIPSRYRAPTEAVSTTAEGLRKEFLAGNPAFPQDGRGLVVACKGEHLSELRLCYSRDFRPLACSGELRDSCPASFLVRPIVGARKKP